MNKLKESILNDVKKDTINARNENTSTTNTATSTAFSTTSTSASDTYVHDTGILAVLAIGFCVFFAHNTSQAVNKTKVNAKQDQPPKRRHML